MLVFHLTGVDGVGFWILDLDWGHGTSRALVSLLPWLILDGERDEKQKRERVKEKGNNKSRRTQTLLIFWDFLQVLPVKVRPY